MEHTEELIVCDKCSFDQCRPEDRYCIKCGNRLEAAVGTGQTQATQEMFEATHVLMKLADICYRKADYAQAAGYWRKVIELEPENESAHALLEKVEARMVRRG